MIADLRWFGRKQGRLLLRAASEYLTVDPLAETQQMKTLRPNRIAQRELRLFNKYRVLFNVDQALTSVTLILVGEKRGEALIVQGERFTAHYESDSPQ